MGVRLLTVPFDPGAETNGFIGRRPSAGAAVTFTGLVRSTPADPIVSLTLECYEEMAQAQLERLLNAAVDRFGLIDAEIIHRHGTMLPGEPIVQVMTLSPHRPEAFAGAEFMMDTLKTDAPFWKKEATHEGARWVEAHEADDARRARWE